MWRRKTLKPNVKDLERQIEFWRKRAEEYGNVKEQLLATRGYEQMAEDRCKRLAADNRKLRKRVHDLIQTSSQVYCITNKALRIDEKTRAQEEFEDDDNATTI